MFQPDESVGVYRVVSKLGAGGMGEVWRAEDSRLGREVALKVLPADVAEDAEKIARFEREAKVLASLNHPNIAHLYGLETGRIGNGNGIGIGIGFKPSSPQALKPCDVPRHGARRRRRPL